MMLILNYGKKMNHLILILLTSVSVWRVCSLLQDEPGPFDIFKKIRTFVGLTSVEDLPLNEQILYSDKEFVHNGEFFAELIECIWCLSIWVGGLFAIYLAITGIIPYSYIPIYTLCSSALTILIKNKEIFNG